MMYNPQINENWTNPSLTLTTLLLHGHTTEKVSGGLCSHCVLIFSPSSTQLALITWALGRMTVTDYRV